MKKNHLSLEEIDFVSHTILRKHIEVQPGHSLLHAYVARKQLRVVQDGIARSFCGHAICREVTSLAHNMGGQIIHSQLALGINHVATIATQTTLSGC